MARGHYGFIPDRVAPFVFMHEIPREKGCTMKFSPLVLPIALAGLLVAPHGANAMPGGASYGAQGSTGCNSCHGGGLTPTVSFSGPTSVEAGSSTEYTLTVSSPGSQIAAGLAVDASIGDLTPGGSQSAQTTLIPSGHGNNNITQSSPKIGNGSETVFSFIFEAPNEGGDLLLQAWGNAVNDNNATTGDAAAKATFNVTVEAPPPPPVPATSPIAQLALVTLLLGAGGFALRRRYSAIR